MIIIRAIETALNTIREFEFNGTMYEVVDVSKKCITGKAEDNVFRVFDRKDLVEKLADKLTYGGDSITI